jgi:[ribosomal protein S18]-alanine N-acetyltransferase
MSKPIQILNQPLSFLLTFDFALLTQASLQVFSQHSVLRTSIIPNFLLAHKSKRSEAKMNLKIIPMNQDAALEFISWRYEGDYAMYNIELEDIESEIAAFLNPENAFFGIYENEELVGHAVFGQEARVPGGDYSAEALDIGAGMRPDWTGQGKGAELISAIIAFAQSQYQPKAFRATIAAWNKRAQKATTKNGFHEISHFKASSTGLEFIIFTREA